MILVVSEFDSRARAYTLTSWWSLIMLVGPRICHAGTSLKLDLDTELHKGAVDDSGEALGFRMLL